MACARCGKEPDADLIRHVAYEGQDEVAEVLLCPECSYGWSTLRDAYVAQRVEAPKRSSA
jgi:DNA-directed RNA polymerase subunit RPC12/RpoP